MAANPARLFVSNGGSINRFLNSLLSYDLPRAFGYEENIVILGECVFHSTLDQTKYALLDLEVFVLLKMYMSATSANRIRFVIFRYGLLTYSGGPDLPALTTGFFI